MNPRTDNDPPEPDSAKAGTEDPNELFNSLFDQALLRPVILQQGVHPDDVGTLLRYVPVALTHMCWRNTILEDWHAGPDSRIGDADMMRANVATSRIFHQYLWASLDAAWADLGPFSWEIVDPEILDNAFFGAFDEAFDPERVLPHGVILGDLAGNAEEFAELTDHASTQLAALANMAEERGSAVVIMMLGLRGLLAGPWWGTPTWPFIVDELFRRLDDPMHSHWKVGGHPGSPPPQAGDRSQFREGLINAPDQLDTAVLHWAIHKAAIGYIRIGATSRTGE